MTITTASGHRVASREVWLRGCIALLAEVKSSTRRRDAIASKVRDLRWFKVDKPSTFDAPTG